MIGVISCQSTGGKDQNVQEPRGSPGVGSAVIGGPVQGKRAVNGKLSGALAGGTIGNYLERQDRDRTAAAIAVGYLPEQGELVKVEAVEASPTTARRGDIVNLTSTYTILTPNNQPTMIRERREIRHNGSVVANPVIDVQRANGTFTSTLLITLPPNVAPGTYDVTTTVSKDERTSQSMTSFTVK